MCYVCAKIIKIISGENTSRELMFWTEWNNNLQLVIKSTRGAVTEPLWTCGRKHIGLFKPFMFTLLLAGFLKNYIHKLYTFQTFGEHYKFITAII